MGTTDGGLLALSAQEVELDIKITAKMNLFYDRPPFYLLSLSAASETLYILSLKISFPTSAVQLLELLLLA